MGVCVYTESTRGTPTWAKLPVRSHGLLDSTRLMLAPGHEPPRALVSAASLAGDTLGELWFEVGLPIAELKPDCQWHLSLGAKYPKVCFYPKGNQQGAG